MSPNGSFRLFGIVTLTICLPTYLLIGLVNSTSGPKMWSLMTSELIARTQKVFAKSLALFGYSPRWTQSNVQRSGSQLGRQFAFLALHGQVCCAGAQGPTGWSPVTNISRTGRFRNRKLRSQSASDAMAARGGFEPTCPNPAMTMSLSSPPTHLVIPANPMVRFKSTSSDLPRTPTGQAAQPIPLLQNGTSTSLEVYEPSQGARDYDEPGPSWLSRLLDRGREHKKTGDEVKFC